MHHAHGVEGAEGGGRRRRSGARERLDWLVGLCELPLGAERVLAELMGLGLTLDDGEPALRWRSTRALAERLGVDEAAVLAELAPTAALAAWGLVRYSGSRVAVNLRIARFLIGETAPRDNVITWRV